MSAPVVLANLVITDGNDPWCAICHEYVTVPHECTPIVLAPVIDMAAARLRHPTGKATSERTA